MKNAMLLIFTLAISACGLSENDKYIGTWEGKGRFSGAFLEIKKDGSVMECPYGIGNGCEHGTWKIDIHKSTKNVNDKSVVVENKYIVFDFQSRSEPQFYFFDYYQRTEDAKKQLEERKENGWVLKSGAVACPTFYAMTNYLISRNGNVILQSQIMEQNGCIFTKEANRVKIIDTKNYDGSSISQVSMVKESLKAYVLSSDLN